MKGTLLSVTTMEQLQQFCEHMQVGDTQAIEYPLPALFARFGPVSKALFQSRPQVMFNFARAGHGFVTSIQVSCLPRIQQPAEPRPPKKRTLLQFLRYYLFFGPIVTAMQCGGRPGGRSRNEAENIIKRFQSPVGCVHPCRFYFYYLK